MNAEMYARVGGKALPEDNLSTVKVINFVDKSGKPVSLTGPQGPAGPQVRLAQLVPLLRSLRPLTLTRRPVLLPTW